jgi:hypothetical protein
VTNVVERIQNLSRAEALEALLALESTLGAAEAPPGGVAQELAKLQEEPLANIVEIEELARLGLVVAATSPETRKDIEEILNATGRKAFVFGGAEIVAAASVAVLVLQVCFTKGKSTETKTTKVTIRPDGGVEVKVDEKTTWGGSGKLAALVKSLAANL